MLARDGVDVGTDLQSVKEGHELATNEVARGTEAQDD